MESSSFLTYYFKIHLLPYLFIEIILSQIIEEEGLFSCELQHVLLLRLSRNKIWEQEQLQIHFLLVTAHIIRIHF